MDRRTDGQTTSDSIVVHHAVKTKLHYKPKNIMLPDSSKNVCTYAFKKLKLSSRQFGAKVASHVTFTPVAWGKSDMVGQV